MKTDEELEKLVEEALDQPRSKFPLVVDIGRLPETQSQATKVCEIFGLKKSDLVRARWVAVDKSRVLKENPDADYSQVLEKIKESKMGKKNVNISKEELEELAFKGRVDRLKIIMGSATEATKFIKRVIKYFESNIHILVHKRVHSTTFCRVRLDENEAVQAEIGLKEKGFMVNFCKRKDDEYDVLVTLVAANHS